MLIFFYDDLPEDADLFDARNVSSIAYYDLSNYEVPFKVRLINFICKLLLW